MAAPGWLSLYNGPTNVVLHEDRGAYRTLEAFAQPPPLLCFIGGSAKSRVLQRVFALHNQSYDGHLHGQVHLLRYPLSSAVCREALCIDCEIHNMSIHQSQPRPQGAWSTQRDICPSHSSKVTRGATSHWLHLGLSLYAHVLVPMAHVIYLFAADLGGLPGTLHALGTMCRAASSGRAPSRVRIVIVRDGQQHSHLPWSSAEVWEQLLQTMCADEDASNREESQLIVQRLVRSLHVLDEEQLSSFAPAEREAVAHIYHERSEAFRNFAGPHLPRLLQERLDTWSHPSSPAFDPILVARRAPFRPSQLQRGLHILFECLPILQRPWPWTHRWIASAMVLESCPPHAHLFHPTETWAQFFQPPLAAALRAIAELTPYEVEQCVTAVERIFTSQYLAHACASDRAGRGSAKELHRTELIAIATRVSGLRSNQVCLCCLYHSPDQMLSCGHAVCDRCIRMYATPSASERHSFRLTACVVCGAAVDAHRAQFDFIPPTAGIRALTIDGGGVRGVVPLVCLSALEQRLRLYGCPLHTYFDFVCGTSSGGLIILAIFILQMTLQEGLAKFESLATRVFRRRTHSSVLFPQIHTFVLSLLLSSKYPKANVLREFQQVYGANVKLFNQLRNGTRVAVTAVGADNSLPYLFTNYNRRPGDDADVRTVLRATRPSEDPSLLDAVASTTAAPWYFEPAHVPPFGKFVDGGIHDNNPASAARSEIRALWGEKGEPDVLLSLGTGDGAASARTRPTHLPQVHQWLDLFKGAVRRHFLVRIAKAFEKSLDAEFAWQTFVKTIDPSLRRRYLRCNPVLGREYAIDDVASMRSLQQETLRFLGPPEVMQAQVDALWASSFYFELDSMPHFDGVAFQCQGSIHNRSFRHMTASGRLNFYRRLVASRARFHVHGRSFRCCVREPAGSPPFRCAVTFGVQHLDEPVPITIQDDGSTQPHLISGSPRSVAHLIHLQSLDAPFGIDDHRRTPKPLPVTPLRIEAWRARSVKKRGYHQVIPSPSTTAPGAHPWRRSARLHGREVASDFPFRVSKSKRTRRGRSGRPEKLPFQDDLGHVTMRWKLQ